MSLSTAESKISIKSGKTNEEKGRGGAQVAKNRRCQGETLKKAVISFKASTGVDVDRCGWLPSKDCARFVTRDM